MFNVIKGEFIKKDKEPIVLDYNDKSENFTEKNELGELKISNNFESEKEQIQKEIEKKKEELAKVEETIAERIASVEEEIKKMHEEAANRIEYETKVSQNRGYQDGYQAGVEKGTEEAVMSAKELLERVKKIHEEMLRQKVDIFEKNEEELIELAYQIAVKIVKKEIDTDKNIIKNNLMEALKKVPISKSITIIVNWEDLEYIKSIKNKLFSEIQGVEKIEIIENKSIERGGCILETSMGTIDATISSQLEIIFEKLTETSNQKNKSEENDGSGE